MRHFTGADLIGTIPKDGVLSPIEPPIAIRIDGNKVGTNRYDQADGYIRGQDAGISFPEQGFGIMQYEPRDGKGPRIAASDYTVEPGAHVLEVAVIKNSVEQRKDLLYFRRNFSIEPDGVLYVTCQYQNKRVGASAMHEWLNIFDGEPIGINVLGCAVSPGGLSANWR